MATLGPTEGVWICLFQYISYLAWVQTPPYWVLNTVIKIDFLGYRTGVVLGRVLERVSIICPIFG